MCLLTFWDNSNILCPRLYICGLRPTDYFDHPYIEGLCKSLFFNSPIYVFLSSFQDLTVHTVFPSFYQHLLPFDSVVQLNVSSTLAKIYWHWLSHRYFLDSHYTIYISFKIQLMEDRLALNVQKALPQPMCGGGIWTIVIRLMSWPLLRHKPRSGVTTLEKCSRIHPEFYNFTTDFSVNAKNIHLTSRFMPEVYCSVRATPFFCDFFFFFNQPILCPLSSSWIGGNWNRSRIINMNMAPDRTLMVGGGRVWQVFQ